MFSDYGCGPDNHINKRLRTYGIGDPTIAQQIYDQMTLKSVGATAPPENPTLEAPRTPRMSTPSVFSSDPFFIESRPGLYCHRCGATGTDLSNSGKGGEGERVNRGCPHPGQMQQVRREIPVRPLPGGNGAGRGGFPPELEGGVHQARGRAGDRGRASRTRKNGGSNHRCRLRRSRPHSPRAQQAITNFSVREQPPPAQTVQPPPQPLPPTESAESARKRRRETSPQAPGDVDIVDVDGVFNEDRVSR